QPAQHATHASTKKAPFPGLLSWARLGSNQRPPACEAGALPLSYAPQGRPTLSHPIGLRRSPTAHRPRPDALLARGQDAVRIESVLQQLVEPPLGVVVEVERVGDRVHATEVRP